MNKKKTSTRREHERQNERQEQGNLVHTVKYRKGMKDEQAAHTYT